MTTSPNPQPVEVPTLLEAWASMLSAEHVAVWGYGVVAARLRAAADPAAETAQTDLARHEALRDVASAAVTGLGGTPEPAAAGYALPEPVADADAAFRLGASLERGCAATYADLVAAAEPADRTRPARWLVVAAGAETRWSDEVPVLPGLDGRIG